MGASAQNVKERLRDYILAEFLPGEDRANLKDDTALRDSGILDSVSTLKLIGYVEDEFKLTVEPHEASSEFNTINEIAALIGRKT